MALKQVEGALAASRCECGPSAVFYSGAEGAHCIKCGNPRQPLLSRMTRDWLRRRIAEERAKGDT